jgi:hypothetical protein
MVKEKLTDTPQLFDWFQKITNINKKKKSYAQVITYCASIFSISLKPGFKTHISVLI